MRRFLATIITMITLTATYRVYSAAIVPLTDVRKVDHPLVTPLETDIRAPAVFEQQAARVFPDVQWTHAARQTWQMAESAYLYFNTFERVPGGGNSIRISPVAIFREDPSRPNAKPFRIVAERAQLKFQNSFFDSAISMSNANPGRVVWASLEGEVHIDGPDGLEIKGQNFKFEEDSLQLYSDHGIAFSFGPTELDKRTISGTADQLQLVFESSPESILGKDMPRVGGLAQVLLRRMVAIDVTMEQKGIPSLTQIRSSGPLQYDVLKREVTLDDHVQIVNVSNPKGAARKDTIDCNRLLLQFDPAQAPPGAKKKSTDSAFDGLVFRSMRAQGSDNGRGSRLKITSDDQQLAAVMQDLTYDATQRRAVLIDQQQVIIHRGNAKFACPQITFQHEENNQLQNLECRGAGQMDLLQADPKAPPAMVRWAKGVQIHPDPNAGAHYIRIEDQAVLGIPGQFGIGADLIHIWVDLDRVQKSTDGQKKTDSQNILAGALPLKRARAENHVRLDSQILKVDRANTIDVVVQPGLIENTTKSTLPGQSGKADQDTEAREPWSISADTLNVDLIHDSGKAMVEVRQASGSGNVEIRHQPGKATTVGNQQIEGPLLMKGNTFIAQNEGGTRQVATLRGEMGPQGEVIQNASVSLGQAMLYGSHITVARHENRIDVPGPGGLTVPLPQNLSGQQGGGPTKLDIVWKEGMSFDGQSARFWGKVTAAVPGEQQSISRLLCEDLNARLNRRISFVDPPPPQTDFSFSEVAARHHVVVEAFEYVQNKLGAVRRSEVAAFNVNLQSGDFKADGPGMIHSWSLGDAVKLAPGDVPRANQPVKPTATDRWRYANVRFAGSIDGNINRSDATLHERVEVLTAPVEKALTKFHREQLSENTTEAENAAWMKCRKMRILQKPGTNSKEKFFEIFAAGDTELEGHVFRAVADELTFDERRGEFTLRGLGKEAELYYQATPGKPVSPSAARMIKFVPVKREIVIDGSSGISGSY